MRRLLDTEAGQLALAALLGSLGALSLLALLVAGTPAASFSLSVKCPTPSGATLAVAVERGQVAKLQRLMELRGVERLDSFD